MVRFTKQKLNRGAKQKLRKVIIMVKILCFGSLNVDYLYSVSHLVQPGETIRCKKLEVEPGGKGLNQAIAISKAGSYVYMAGAVSDSDNLVVEHCKNNGVNVDHIVSTPAETGHAIIQVSEEGQNCILLHGGANMQIQKCNIDKTFESFGEGDYLVLQNEINEVSYIMEKGRQKGMKIVFNPSPYNEAVANYPLDKIDVLILNEVEGAQFTGKKTQREILSQLSEMFPNLLIVLTLGEKGVILKDKNEEVMQEALKVTAVDTTGAGDTFTGYFVSLLSLNRSYRRCLEIAVKAAAIAVLSKGASVSIPKMEVVLNVK